MNDSKADNSPRSTALHTSLKHGSRSLRIRRQFQRWLWAGLFFTGSLLLFLHLIEQFDELNSNEGVALLICGALLASLLGSFIGPYLTQITRQKSRRRDSSRRS